MSFIEKINTKISLFKNQKFYGEKVGVYLIEEPDKIVLFDLPIYSKEIEEYLLSFNKQLVCFLSHGSCGIPDGKKWQERVGLKVYLHEADENSEWLRMTPDTLYKELPKISTNLTLIFTPGHTPGSVCLLDRDIKTLFTGDTFGGKNGEVRDFIKENGNGNLDKRFESCKMLLKYDFENILPFHYEIILKTGKDALKRFVDSKS